MRRGTSLVGAGVIVLLILSAPLPIAAQSSGPQRIVLTEAQRREILKAERALTPETFRQALEKAEAGDLDAQVLVGLAYGSGSGVEKDAVAAVRWYRVAAEKGHPTAMNALGVVHTRGDGVPRDDAVAVEWFRKAAAQEYAQSNSHLGWAYYTGAGVERSYEEALRLFRLAAAQGNASAQNRLGVAYMEGNALPADQREATAWFEKAAEGGEPAAARNLAQVHYTGAGTPRDPSKAMEWYRKAADAGDPVSQYALGLGYFNGDGVRKNKDEAGSWFDKSSKNGYALGSYAKGQLYVGGPGPLRTLAGVDALELSAAQGYPVAAFRLGLLYSSRFSPHPIGKNDMLACTWFGVASVLDKSGDWDVQQPVDVAEMRRELPQRLQRLRASLGTAGSTECEQRIAEWAAKHKRP